EADGYVLARAVGPHHDQHRPLLNELRVHDLRTARGPDRVLGQVEGARALSGEARPVGQPPQPTSIHTHHVDVALAARAAGVAGVEGRLLAVRRAVGVGGVEAERGQALEAATPD